MQTEQTRNLS